MATSRPSSRVLGGVALVCFANLILEIVLTRIFSAVMFYHFTFLAIAAALFGLGASGVYIYLRQERFTAETIEDDLASASMWFSIFSILAVTLILLSPLNMSAMKDIMGASVVLRILLLTTVTFLPFFFSGLVVSLALFQYRDSVGRVYFYDLSAAAAAAVVVSLPLRYLGGPSAVLFAASIAIVGSWSFATPGKIRRLVGIGILLVLPLNLVFGFIDVPKVKGVQARLLFERWNAHSRVTVEVSSEQGNIKIDSDASTRVGRLTDKRRERWHKDIHPLAYSAFARPVKSVLIIGPGGGRDVVNGLAAGAEKIIGVEINPIIANDIMRGEFREASGNLYFHPKVTIVVDEGRSYIRRTNEKFEILQATLVDTWAATAAGAFALTENALYTREAFQEYYKHLSDTGVLTMSRWYRPKGAETQRLVVLAAEALRDIGVKDEDVRKHMFLAITGGVPGLATLIVAKHPLTSEAIAGLRARCRANRFQVIISPDSPAKHPLELMVDQGVDGELVAASNYDLWPPSDDRPFFFFFDRPGSILSLDALTKSGDTWRSPGQWVIATFGLVICVLALVFIVLPLFLRRKQSAKVDREGAKLIRACGLAFFGVVGFAFMIIEIGLMQKFGLFLGHPTFGLMVVLPAILVAVALGAALSEKLPMSKALLTTTVGAGGVCLISIVYGAVLDPLLSDWIAWKPIPRIIVTIVLCMVPGVAMGLMVPVGIRVLSKRDHDLIPWAWGLNGATSVVGTVAGTVLAIQIGFNGTLVLGGILYLVAAAVAAIMIRSGGY